MRVQLLPSSFDAQGCAAPEQRLTCYLVDERVCVDAGSIAIALSDEQRGQVRDCIITHPHIDHIASLPIFLDDLFSTLTEPVRIHTTREIIELLERDIFNWTVYPRFSELSNDRTRIMEYVPFQIGEEFQVAHLRVTAVAVNHSVPTVGLLVSNSKTTIAFSSDTAETEDFWTLINRAPYLDALIIEASFPNRMAELATASKHLTPNSLQRELGKLADQHQGLNVLAVHLKPAYREPLVAELNALGIRNLSVMEPGRTYEW